MLQEKRMVQTLVNLLEIKSPTGDTAEAIHFVKEKFNQLGIEVEITKKGALIGKIPGKSSGSRAVSAHVDTLGAMVKEIKSNGRLKLSQIGGFPWATIDGEYCTVKAFNGKEYRGTVLFDKTASHTYGSISGETVRNEGNIEVRLDEEVFTKTDTKNLGIEVGDFVCLDPRTEVTESGFLKSRHLDDKACVAILIEVATMIKEENLVLPKTAIFFISNYEEVGHGACGVLDDTVEELVAVDMACPGPEQNSTEYGVTICAKDSSGPYDLELKKKLVQLCKNENLDYHLDIYNYYGSDASAAMRSGAQIKHGLIGPGVDASHAYERTHIKGLRNTAQLLYAYLTK
ncbi:MAG: M42 family metallopeptidase [Fusobacteriaceae bacterium]